ncbi:hypothetical protein ACQRD4_03265 [Streptococcus hyointestinalis]|nr:hypothetical protein [Streptococcus hyointestinalis]
MINPFQANELVLLADYESQLTAIAPYYTIEMGILRDGKSQVLHFATGVL